MIKKADAKLLNEIAERKLKVSLQNADLTLQASCVYITAPRPGHAYAATVSNGNASLTFIIAKLRGHARMADGALMLYV